MKKQFLSDQIKELADSLGIDAIGFARADDFTNYALPGSPRRSPALSLPAAKSIVVAGIYIGGLALPRWSDPWFGRTSRLYLSGFFLDVVKPLEPLAVLLKNQGYQALICNSTTENGSILPLKLAAVRAGLGWQGKHSLLISRKYGTFLALGGLITDAELEYNSELEPDRCRKCQECRKACPVGALSEPYVLNRERCLSNLLSDENLPPSVVAVLENRVGDCEICQEACPWNRKHLENPLATRMTPRLREKADELAKYFPLPKLSELTESEYQDIFGRLNTGIPFHILQRNVALALERAKRISDTKVGETD